VIVISEEIAREGIEEILDFFGRDPEMRRRVKILVTKGEAKSALSVEPKIEDYSSIYLASIPINARSNSRIIHKTDLGEVIKSIHAGFDFVLPMTEVADNEIKASGGAAFKYGKMVGWVSELEIDAIKLIRSLYLGGVITVSSPEHGQGIVTMEVTSAKSNITPVITGDEVVFNIDIKIKGNYAENVNMHSHAQLDDSFMQKLEKAYEKEAQRICLNAANKMQVEYGADIFRLNQILQTEEPAYWKRISDQWDIMYPHVEVNINADVTLQQVGLVK
ncbi:MAG: Ger(x)C family spore germination protein, partial [Clostridiales bacterium]|nr:Ger(x)C family spore germination protein [Clostridiales bacterium]